MQTSEQINELAAALSKAQAKIIGALKDAANPFFKSKYADLSSVWDAVREPLTANGLSVLQTTSTSESGGVVVTTMLMHSSGQWVRDALELLPKDKSPQGMGSAITYGRRYALAAITGCPQIDDDGEASMGRKSGPTNDPRGDGHKSVDPAVVAKMVNRVADVLNQDKEEVDIAKDVLALHNELNADQDLYIAVGDKLAADKIISRKGWLDYLNMNKPRTRVA